MMSTLPKKPAVPLSADEAKLIERMIRGCGEYVAGKITLDQLWYRCRGDRLGRAIQHVAGRELGYMLYQLHMDFICWYRDRNDIVHRSAEQVLEAVAHEQAHGARA